MINIAILGAGIGREHLAALRRLPDRFKVSKIVDQDSARAESLRRDGDAFAVIQNIEDALSDPDIDIIDVCLPPHLHVPTTLSALNAGKHVVCEKPLAVSLKDTDDIRAASEKTGKSVFPVFQYRWGPALAQLRHLMNQGLTGQVNSVALETHWSRDAEYYAVPWRGTWAGESGGAVLGHAIHNHDLLTHLAGKVKALSAMTATQINPIETEDTAVITLQLESGALCTSSITLGAAGDQTRLRIVFENLTATSGTEPYAPGAGEWTFIARDPERQTDVEAALLAAPAEPIGFEGFFTEVHKALVDQPNSAVTLQDGIASIELVTAIYHAARTGSRVALPLSPNHALYEGWLP